MSAFEAMDRRSFVAAAGSLFLSALDARSASVLGQTDLLFASCVKQPNGQYGAILLNERRELITEVELPGRGHAVIFDNNAKRAVAFARRPGNFALVFSTDKSAPAQTIIAAKGRHFYGHGVFSPTGDLLFASENDFEASVGKIGIYDATDNFKRLGEFESHGVGPHEIVLMPGGKTLAIANGGIETHPEFGRAKLNLSTMQPSIVLLDLATGELIEKHILPSNLSRLSIRHMAVTPDNSLIFGCQFEGPKSATPPLIGRCDPGGGIKIWPMEPDNLLANYTGSVAVTPDGKHAAISSSKGGVFIVIDATSGNLVKIVEMEGCGGLTHTKQDFIASSDRGRLMDEGATSQYPFLFDNHLTRSSLA